MKLSRRNFLGAMLAGAGVVIASVLPKTKIAADELESPYIFDDPEVVAGFENAEAGALTPDDIRVFVSRNPRSPNFDLDLRDLPSITCNQVSEAIFAFRTNYALHGPARIIITPAQNKSLMREFSSEAPAYDELQVIKGIRVHIMPYAAANVARDFVIAI